MTSKKQQNSGFLLPNPVTGYDTVCLTLQIPNVREYRAAIVGHLYKLGNWWSWEKSYTPSDERAKQAAAMWRRLLAETLQINECGYEPPGGDPVATGCVPIGWIISTATAATPDGFLPCDGGTYLRVDYPLLYAALDSHLILDADHFQTPEIKDGRAPIGIGSYQVWRDGATVTIPVNVGSQVGEYQHRLNIDELPTHAHNRNPNEYPEYSLRYGASGSYGFGAGSAPALSNIQSTDSVGGSKYHNNVGPGTGLRFFIRATDCQQTGMENFDMRLDGCVLQYTFNGSMWFVVDGWTTFPTCITHPETGQPFDLRINNCLLEYSKDSAQTWNTVPGWSSMATCFPDAWTPDDFNMRVEGGVLQYTEDGGDNWNPVFGWNTLQDTFIAEKSRCENAYGMQRLVFTSYLNALTGNLAAYEGDLSGFVTAMNTWYDEHLDFPPRLPSWNTTDLPSIFADYTAAEIAGEATSTNAELFANIVYTYSTNGEWCTDQWADLESHLLCLTLTESSLWAHLVLGLLGMWFTDEDTARVALYKMRAYGTCGNCNQLSVVEACNNTPQDWNCFRNFGISGLGGWSVVMVNAGTQSMDSEGVRLTGDNTLIYKQMEIERPLNGVSSSITITTRFEKSGGGSDPRREIWVRIGGSWTRATYWQSYVDGNYNDTASIPAGCDAVRIRVQFTTGYTSAWIKSAQMIINAVDDPC